MSRVLKIIDVLRLFDDSRRVVRASDVEQLLDVSHATAYRCIKVLLDSGLLEPAGGGSYVLGPTIVELDRQIRIHDPLIDASDDVMRGLSGKLGATMLLCRRHGLKVLCIHQTHGHAAPAIMGYERGRAMSLYLAATSKAVMAHVDDATLRQLIDEDSAGLKRAGLPTRLKPLTELMVAWRAAPVIETQAEVNPDAHGWSVPLFQGRHLLGSLTVVLSRSAPQAAAAAVPEQLLRARLRIEARLDEAAAK